MNKMKYKGILYAVLLISFGFYHAAWAGDWNLKGKDGVHYSLSSLHGKWVLVNFWAPWCPSCIQELPDLISLQQRHQNMQVIGVAVMYDSRKEVADIINKQAITYPVIYGNEDTAGDFGGMDGMPTSFLYSPSGKLIGRYEGPLSKNEVERAME